MRVMCRVCLKLDDRIAAEPIKGRKSLYYRNLSGRRWHGFRCPACHASAAKFRHRKQEIPALAVVQTQRKCRICKKPLPEDRYFKHRACDRALVAYTSNGHIPTIWVESDWGCGVSTGVRF